MAANQKYIFYAIGIFTLGLLVSVALSQHYSQTESEYDAKILEWKGTSPESVRLLAKQRNDAYRRWQITMTLAVIFGFILVWLYVHAYESVNRALAKCVNV